MILSLSRRIQKQAQRQVVRLSFTNALGFGFITAQVIYLIALMYGANDTQMGLLYAAPFTTALAALFVPLLLNGRETTATWSRFWWIRTVLCLGYFAIPFVGSIPLRIWLFVLIYYAFMTLRAFGMSGYFTVMRALAPPQDNATLMAKGHLAAQLAVLLTQCLAFSVLTINLLGSEERNLFFLVGIGIGFNGLTAWLIGQLPRTGYLEDGSMRNLLKAARHIAAVPAYREVAIVTAFQAAMTVFAGYVISYMRNVAQFSSGEIFLFTVAGFSGAIFISNLLRLIGSRIRPRVMLFASHAVLALLSLLWALMRVMPAVSGLPVVIMLLYGLTVVCLTASTTIALQLRTGRLPARHSVDYSINYDMAQVTGAVIAITCARFTALPAWQTAGRVHPYSLTFLLWSLSCVAVCALALRMRSHASGGFRQEVSSLLPSNIFTIIRAHRLDQDDNVVRRHLALEGLLQAPNQVSRELILEHLNSPDTGIRRSCIRVLMGYPMQAALPALLKEAASPFSPLRAEAITALGFTARRDLIPALRQIWDDAPCEIRAALVKTLLRLGAEVPEPEIRTVWAHAPRDSRADILIGLALTGHSGLLFALLGEALAERPDPFWSRPLFGYTAAAAGERASMFDVFTEEDQHPGKGIAYITANYEGQWPEGLLAADCAQLISQERYGDLMDRLRGFCNQEWVMCYDCSTALGVLFLLLLRHDGRFTPA